METELRNLSYFLPDGYTIDVNSYSIRKGDKEMANFVPVVASVDVKIKGRSRHTSYAIVFYFKDQKSMMISVEDKDFEKQSFYPTPACFGGQKKPITNFIRKQILEAEVRELYQVSNGWNTIASNYIYCMGTTICRTSEASLYIEPNTPAICLSSNNAYTNSQHLWQFLTLSENVPPILLLGTAAGLLGTLLHQTGFSPLIIFLYGKSSLFKTSLAKLLAAVHGPGANMIALSSSPTSIRDFVINHKDIPVIIDDMNKSDRKSIMLRNEETVSNLCQMIVDSGKLVLHQGRALEEIEFCNSAIITAEYTLKNTSTRNRVIELPMEKISPQSLHTCQELEYSEKVMETFAYHFTTFVANNQQEVLKRLQAEHANPQNDICGVNSNSSYRINTNLCQLFAVAHIIELYLKQEVQLPLRYLKNWTDIFYQCIRNTCSNQLHEIADTERDLENTKYLIAFYDQVTTYFARLSDLPEGEDDYKEDLKRAKEEGYWEYGEAAICFLQEGTEDVLCIDPNIALQLLTSIYPEATKKAFSKQLSGYNLVKKDTEGKATIRLSCESKRYYHIYFNDLERIVEEVKSKA